MRFQGKIDIWFWVIMVLGEGALIYSIAAGESSRGSLCFGLLIYNVIFLPLVLRNYVEIEEDRVTVVFGFFRQSILLSELEEVYRTWNPVSSTAASLDRIVLKGERRTILCAVKKRDDFFACLKEKVPGLTVWTDKRQMGRGAREKLGAIVGIAVFVIAGVLLFTGHITMEYGREAFVVKASYWPDRTIAYKDIDRMVLSENPDAGARVGGFGSFRLLMGNFENEEFGAYTRYTYTNCSQAVVLYAEGEIIVLSGKDPEETKQIYLELLKRTGSEGREEVSSHLAFSVSRTRRITHS